LTFIHAIHAQTYYLLPLAELKHPLSHTIQHALATSRNISSLYTHQVAAITALAEGKHVIVSTPTASGKSVIYQVLLRFIFCEITYFWSCYASSFVGSGLELLGTGSFRYSNLCIPHEGD
jgi:hypothetical protein